MKIQQVGNYQYDNKMNSKQSFGAVVSKALIEELRSNATICCKEKISFSFTDLWKIIESKMGKIEKWGDSSFVLEKTYPEKYTQETVFSLKSKLFRGTSHKDTPITTDDPLEMIEGFLRLKKEKFNDARKDIINGYVNGRFFFKKSPLLESFNVEAFAKKHKLDSETKEMFEQRRSKEIKKYAKRKEQWSRMFPDTSPQ